MAKVVLLVRNYLPFSNAVGVCAEAIAGALQDLYPGNELFVICEKTKIDQPDCEIINGVIVKRFITKKTSSLLKSKNSLSRLVSRLSSFLYDCFSLYLANRGMVRCFERELLSVQLSVDDIILPFCAPFESIIASTRIRKKLSFHLVPILYDLYSGCKYTNRGVVGELLKYPFNRHLERKMEQLSDHILYSSCWEKYLKNSIGKKKATHIEVPLLFSHAFKNSTPSFDINKINIVYCGNFNRKMRKSDFFCKLFSKFLQHNEEVVLHIIGNGDRDKNILKLRSTFGCSVVLYGFIAHDDAIKLLHQAQAIVVVGNENKKQFPSKIVEALAFSSKIIVVSKVAHPYLDFISKNSNCFVVNKRNVNDIVSLEKFLHTPSKTEDYSTKPCFKELTPAYTASIIGATGGLRGKE